MKSLLPLLLPPPGAYRRPPGLTQGVASLRSLALGWELATPSGFSLNACLPYNQHPQVFFYKPDSPKTKFPRLFLCFALALHYLCARIALVAKLVDAPDLGSGGSGRVGSSPIRRTQKKQHGTVRKGGAVLFLCLLLRPSGLPRLRNEACAEVGVGLSFGGVDAGEE